MYSNRKTVFLIALACILGYYRTTAKPRVKRQDDGCCANPPCTKPCCDGFKLVNNECQSCDKWDTHKDCPYIHITTGCPQDALTGAASRMGIIQIDSADDCKSVISGPRGSILYVEFLNFSLKSKTQSSTCDTWEGGSACKNKCRRNYLQVYDALQSPGKKYCGSDNIGLVGVEAENTNSSPTIIVDYFANGHYGSYEVAYEMVGGEPITTTAPPTTTTPTVATIPETTTKVTNRGIGDFCDDEKLYHSDPTTMLHYCVNKKSYDIAGEYPAMCRCPDSKKYLNGSNPSNCVTKNECEGIVVTTLPPTTVASTTPKCAGDLEYDPEPRDAIKYCNNMKANTLPIQSVVLQCDCPRHLYVYNSVRCVTKEECEGTETQEEPLPQPTTTTTTPTTTTTTTTTRPTTTTTTTTPTTTTTTTTVAPPKTCGVPPLKPVLKIFGGREARKNTWPWMVQVVKKSTHPSYPSMSICGGTLICNRYVLTAAHCFLTANKYGIETHLSLFEFHFGAHNVYDENNQEENTKVVTKFKLKVHEDYTVPDNGNNNDIALVTLTSAIKISDTILPACLPSDPRFNPDDQPDYNEICISMGWGSTSASKSSSQELKQTRMKIVSGGPCMNYYNSYDFERMMCVDGEKSRDDTCQGDSGGPLMCNRNGVWYLDGIISHGLECAGKAPGVYTRVGRYRDWITRNMRSSDSKCLKESFKF